jgi:hypothetical protein
MISRAKGITESPAHVWTKMMKRRAMHANRIASFISRFSDLGLCSKRPEETLDFVPRFGFFFKKRRKKACEDKIL